MKVEIWSDIMCPFCYIGKRKFEKALAQFENAEQIEIIWKSFQLNPGMKTDPKKSINEYLAEIKGMPIEQAKEINEHVTQLAKEVGLQYNFDKAIVANSMDAHRLIQFAKEKNKDGEAEERLFTAYFTEGKNIADHSTLALLASEIGLNSEEVHSFLKSNKYTEEVNHDIAEAQKIGVRGVPFFVIDRKYGISGAQESDKFLQALTKAWSEKVSENK